MPGKIVQIQGEAQSLQRTGRVSFGGIVKEVNLACVPEAKVGDYVIVHVGLALSTVDPEEAERTLEYFRQMGELAELEESAGSNGTEAKLEERRATERRALPDPGVDKVQDEGSWRELQ